MTTQGDPIPGEFFLAFLRVTSARKDQLLTTWPDNRSHTTAMCNEILPAVGEALGLFHSAEYYGLDAVFFREQDRLNFIHPDDRYAKYLSAAIEHENDYATSAVEMNKLQLFNTPLSVLITYPETPAKGARLLEKYAGIVQAADVLGNASTQRRQLVIFGYKGPKWEPFVYHGGRFAFLDVAMERSAST